MGSFQGICAITRLPLNAGDKVFAFVYSLSPEVKQLELNSTHGLHSIVWGMRNRVPLFANLDRKWLNLLSPWFGLGAYNDYGWVEDEQGDEPPEQGNDIWMVHRWVAAEIHDFERGDSLLASLGEFAFCARIQLFPIAANNLLGQQYADERDMQRHRLLAKLIERGAAAWELDRVG